MDKNEVYPIIIHHPGVFYPTTLGLTLTLFLFLARSYSSSSSSYFPSPLHSLTLLILFFPRLPLPPSHSDEQVNSALAVSWSVQDLHFCNIFYFFPFHGFLLHFELQLLWFGSNSLNLEFFKVYLFLVFLDFQIICVKLISPPFWPFGSRVVC